MSRRTAPVIAETKSAAFRRELEIEIAAGNEFPIANAARTVGIGYAFAYGIAVRAGRAKVGANRRAEPNAKVRAVVAFVRPDWSADRIARTAAAFVAGEPLPNR
jgi:hypothetical protein